VAGRILHIMQVGSLINVERVVTLTSMLTMTKGDMVDDEEEDGGETASVRNMTTYKCI
jgi:hypothetical protein